jgi:hypothetical protein
VDGDLYYIGHYWMSVESGDLTDSDPETQHKIQSLTLHLESGFLGDTGENAITAGIAKLPRSDSATAFAYGGSMADGKVVQQLDAGGVTAYTQRLRLLMRMGAARFRLFAVTVKRALTGRPLG